MLYHQAPRDFTNRIIAGDCLKVLPQMPAASVDLILTDPPYLVNYRSQDGRTVAGDQQDFWIRPAFEAMYRVLKNDRFCVSFYGWSKADKFFQAWRTAGFYPVGHLVWTKPYPSAGHFVQYHHEQAYLLAKGRPAKPQALLRDVLEWKYSGNELHPTQKPVAALLPLILAFSKMRDVVLDPFSGSGSTAVAARLLGRQYIGIELSPDYCQAAEARLRGL